MQDHQTSKWEPLKREALTGVAVALVAAILFSALAVAMRSIREHAKPPPLPEPEQSAWVMPRPTTNPVELTLEQLGNSDFKNAGTEELPERIKSLNGTTIRLRGYIWPMTEPPMKTFALGPTPFDPENGNESNPQQTAIIINPPGKACDYHPCEVTVDGTLHLQTTYQHGEVISLFEVFASSVKATPTPTSAPTALNPSARPTSPRP